MYAGWRIEEVEVGEPGTPGGVVYRIYHSYQLNLAVADRGKPRLNLCSHSDLGWMRQASHRLAGFLRVPVLEHLPRGHEPRAVSADRSRGRARRTDRGGMTCFRGRSSPGRRDG